MVSWNNTGFLKKGFHDRTATVGKEFFQARVALERCAAVAIYIQLIKFWIVARLETVGGVDLAAIKHNVESLRGCEPGHRNARRRRGVNIQHAAVAQFRDAPDEPGDLTRRYREQLTQKNSHPERCGHDIVRHTNTLAFKVGQAPDTGLRADEQTQPNECFGWKDRQRRPLPAIAAGALARDEILGQRHFENVKLIVFQIAEKQFWRRRDSDIEVEPWRLNGFVNERLETRIFGDADFQFEHRGILAGIFILHTTSRRRTQTLPFAAVVRGLIVSRKLYRAV